MAWAYRRGFEMVRQAVDKHGGRFAARAPRLRVAASIASVVAVGLTAMGTPTASAATRPAPRTTVVNITPSGQAMPVGDVGVWKQIYTDDFPTNVPIGSFPKAVSSKWGAYPDGWKDTSKRGTYSPSKVISVRNGVLDMHLRTENGVPLVSAPTPKINGAGKWEGQLYGRYAVRFRSDTMPGYKIAWLLWPDSDAWSDGEIDFPEADLDGKIWGFMHHRNNPTQQDWFSTASKLNTWHTAVLEWHPRYVRFILDGVVIGVSRDTTKIPNKAMHWVLQTETGLSGRAPSPSVAGHLQIDWVAAYRLQR